MKFRDIDERENQYKFEEKSSPKPETDEEMEGAWDYFVRTGDFSLVNNLREQRALHNWFMNRYD